MTTETPEPQETPDEPSSAAEPTEVMPAAEDTEVTPLVADATSAPGHRHGHGRRRWLLAAAGLTGVALVAAVVLATDGDDPDTTTSASTSSTAPATTTTTVETSSTTPTTDAPTTAAPGVTTPSPTTTAPDTGQLPDEPGDYAGAAFAAWQQGDVATLERLATPSVVAFLTAHVPEPGPWTGPVVEGAAGSSYCVWTSPDVEVVLRVGNEAAFNHEQHAVRGAQIEPAPGRAAIWPVTTAADAGHLQEKVDKGHQPWLLDPVAVSRSYAEAELGWIGATVEPGEAGSYHVTDPRSGASAWLLLVQPARAGGTGIWAVVQAGAG